MSALSNADCAKLLTSEALAISSDATTVAQKQLPSRVAAFVRHRLQRDGICQMCHVWNEFPKAFRPLLVAVASNDFVLRYHDKIVNGAYRFTYCLSERALAPAPAPVLAFAPVAPPAPDPPPPPAPAPAPAPKAPIDTPSPPSTTPAPVPAVAPAPAPAPKAPIDTPAPAPPWQASPTQPMAPPPTSPGGQRFCVVVNDRRVPAFKLADRMHLKKHSYGLTPHWAGRRGITLSGLTLQRARTHNRRCCIGKCSKRRVECGSFMICVWSEYGNLANAACVRCLPRADAVQAKADFSEAASSLSPNERAALYKELEFVAAGSSTPPPLSAPSAALSHGHPLTVDRSARAVIDRHHAAAAAIADALAAARASEDEGGVEFVRERSWKERDLAARGACIQLD